MTGTRIGWRGTPAVLFNSNKSVGTSQRADMKFFVDTADTAEIRSLAASGLLDGVTTNPSLVAKTGKKFLDVLADICATVSGPVSAAVAATDFDGMMAEARVVRGVA